MAFFGGKEKGFRSTGLYFYPTKTTDLELPLLPDIVVILGLSVLIILIFQRLKIPAILGFLVTGIIAGPHGLSLIKGTHEVELLSEIGVVFLLFVIGIEFSLKGLAAIKSTVLWGGLLQVGGTIGLTLLGTWLLDLSWAEAVFMGFLLSLSSTAIVLKMMQERGEVTAPHGRVSVAILIFQDIIVVPMMLVTPLLTGQTDDLMTTVLVLVAKMVLVITVVILLARYVVPRILLQVVRAKSSELFVLTIVVLCFATAWLTSSVGLSLALGAFFAGLVISESPYSHQATANILPFREIFISFFFVSIGMLLDIKFFWEHIISVHLLAGGVMVAKFGVAMLAAALLRYKMQTALLVGLSLFQVGEFAFLLSVTGLQFELISAVNYQFFLAVSIISMGATPFVIQNADRIVKFILGAPLPSKVRRRMQAFAKLGENHNTAEESLHDHLIIVGFGINGRNVAKAARHADIPYVILELDPEVIREAEADDEPVIYGNAADEIILKHVHVHEARTIVIAISDPNATKKIVQSIRTFTETAWVIVRTRYVREIEELVKVGADEVIPEEFETSVQIFTRVLNKYMVPADEIQNFARHVRHHNYELLREKMGPNSIMPHLHVDVPNAEIANLSVRPGSQVVVGKTIRSAAIRSRYSITILTIRRHGRYITDITPDTTILADDCLYVFGSPESVVDFQKLLRE